MFVFSKRFSFFLINDELCFVFVQSKKQEHFECCLEFLVVSFTHLCLSAIPQTSFMSIFFLYLTDDITSCIQKFNDHPKFLDSVHGISLA